MHSTVKRSESVLASRAKASRCSPCAHQVTIQRSNGAKQLTTTTSLLCLPCFSPASEHHSRSRCRHSSFHSVDSPSWRNSTALRPPLVACSSAASALTLSVPIAIMRPYETSHSSDTSFQVTLIGYRSHMRCFFAWSPPFFLPRLLAFHKPTPERLCWRMTL